MKKTIIAGIVTLIAGSLIFGAGFAMSGGDITAMNVNTELVHIFMGSGAQRVSAEYDLDAEGVKEIVVETTYDSVELGTSSDGRIHVVCGEDAGGRYTINEGSTLKIIQGRKRSFLTVSFGGTRACVTTVLVPADRALPVKISTASGSVTVLEGMRVGSLKLHTMSGGIRCPELEADSFDAETTSGGIVLGKVTVSGEFEAESTSGRVTAKSLTAREAEIDTTSGGVVIERLDVSKKAEIGSTSGSIRLKMAGSERDYAISWDTSSGRCRLPNNTHGEIKLELETTSGNIDVAFSD